MFLDENVRFRPGSGGTAMTEFVLVLPFLALVLVLTFFFGWAMMHKHQVIAANRYSAWQRVQTGVWPSRDALNDAAFDNRASNVDSSPSQSVTETADDLVSQAGQVSARTGILADELVRGRFPGGSAARVSAGFTSNQPIWQRYTGSIHSRHGREGVTWRRADVSCWETLSDLYYSEVDTAMEQMPAPADGMARMIRNLYLENW